MLIKSPVFFLLILFALASCKKEEVVRSPLVINRVFIGAHELNLAGGVNDNMPVDQHISVVFSSAVRRPLVSGAITLTANGQSIDFDVNYSDENKNVVIIPRQTLPHNANHTLSVSEHLEGAGGESIIAENITFKTAPGQLVISSVKIGDQEVIGSGVLSNVPLDFSMIMEFTFPVNEDDVKEAFKLSGYVAAGLEFQFHESGKQIMVTGKTPLPYLSKYRVEITKALKGTGGESFAGFSTTFYTTIDPTPKFPLLSDDELLTKTQQQTFKYFWDFGHPVSGLARERDTSGETVATGGSGFGIMAIMVGIERGFITREEGLTRLRTMIDFLSNADRFHGAWPHWINGSTGKVIPFSTKDNGGDLVETSYVVMGLLTLRPYLHVTEDAVLIDKIDALVDGVEWDWYTRGENVLTWHWSPEYGWDMNLKIRGWNEALITYVLARASKSHQISGEVYQQGWKNSDHFLNGKTFYDITLPLGIDYGGPLFFEHYSFLGIDPRNLKDDRINYWQQAVNHTLINRAYCVANPKKYIAYSGQCWGLTASDGHNGYSAHSPTNDRGVISPTAALSSFPYTPEASMDALRFFYDTMGDRLWGPYGFYDAFNVTEGWYATSNIAIDQGPIMVMIENHRTGLLWDLFMSNPEIQQSLTDLGFTF
ncbi:MAG: hypothetical protein HC819_21030 [Cyclobacteriaceae bacterium]|nr:hypothetical protein [Cyclobacteriaceae bacterium]